MRTRQLTIDRLPEMEAFRDDGCALHPACLSCPLPRCRYDEPGWLQREERDARDAEVLRLRSRQALSVEDLAAQFKLSTRTVHRILSTKRGPGVIQPASKPRAWELLAG